MELRESGIENKRLTIKSLNIIKSETAFVFFLAVIYAIYLSVNIYPFRQIVGFIIFLIIPGWLLLRIGKFDHFRFWENISLSVCLSISYIMLLGGLINWLYYIMGITTQPLSTDSLLFTFMTGIFIIGTISFWINPIYGFPSFVSAIDVVLREPLILVALFFPILAIIGTSFMNESDDNLILLILYFIIPTYIIILSLIRSRSQHLYAVASWAIGLTLILMFSLRSNHILGYDVHFEYFLFQQVLKNFHWDIATRFSPPNACLSVVILPVAIKSMLSINSEYVYKAIYAVLFSFVPLIIYITSKKYIDDPFAFLAAIFFISQAPFIICSQSDPRTAIALLYLASVLLVLADDKINITLKRVLIIIFSISIVFSHYSTAIIFSMLIFFGFLAGYISKNLKNEPYTIIQQGLLLLIIILTFLWYAQICETSLETGIIGVFKGVLYHQKDFFIAESRQQGTLQVVGVGARSVGDLFFTLSHYIVAFIIAVGSFRLFYSAISDNKIKMLHKELKPEYLGMLAMTIVILISIIVLPHLSKGYSPERLWTQSMVLLSLPFIIGALTLVKGSKRKGITLILIVLLLHYANSNYLIYQLTGEPRSLVLNSDGPEFAHFYIHDAESIATEWINGTMKAGSKIYSDADGSTRLNNEYIMSTWDTLLMFKKGKHIGKGDYLYLGYFNIVLRKIYDGRFYHVIENFSHLFIKNNKIYDNGNVYIYNN